MILKIDTAGNVPIYRQIRNQIIYGAATGRLKTGERLPTVRQLAGDIGVNPMTVSKAYELLKSEGVIVMDRRRGAQIKEFHAEENPLDKNFDDALKALISEYRIKGASKEKLTERTLSIIDSIYGQKEEF